MSGAASVLSTCACPEPPGAAETYCELGVVVTHLSTRPSLSGHYVEALHVECVHLALVNLWVYGAMVRTPIKQPLGKIMHLNVSG